MASRIAHAIDLIRIAGLSGVISAALMAGPALADVKDGVDAWSNGDYDRAVAEWQGPAQSGDPDALFNLAQAYRLGRGVEADILQAKHLYAQAAQKGHVKAADNYGLLLFQQGEQDQAMPFIRSAAERGDPRAQYVLGLAHFNADYAEKDWVKAYAYLTLAQSAGLPQAINALSQMDQYVPSEQRQLAQSLARQIEAEATQRRTADLAAADLGSRPASAPSAGQQTFSRLPEAPARAFSNAAAQPAATQRAPAPVRAAVPASTPVATGPRGNWSVQLGAFGVPGNADRLWNKLSGNAALAGTTKKLVPAGKITKLKAHGFATRADAQSACAELKRQGQGCLVTKG